MQAWARKLRYDAAALLALSRAADIAAGHTATDQVETILYRLASSPSRRALLGMRPRDGNLIRPLLGVTREQTGAYCRERGLGWRDDESNDTDAYARSRVRHGLVPALREIHPGAEQNVLALADQLRDESEVLDLLVDRELAGTPQIELARLRAMPAAIARLIVQRLADQVHAATHARHESASGRHPGAARRRPRARRPARRRARERARRRAPVQPHARDRARSINWFRVVAKDLKPGEIIVESDDLQRRVRELAAEVSGDYAGKDLLLIGVLKGAIFFLADFMRALEIECEVDFMAISSYGSSTKSSGVVRILKDLDAAIEGRHVLIVEDIVDSGLTLQYLLRNLAGRRPASLEVCALLLKPTSSQVPIQPRYVGFEIPDRFVVGYGLDHAERYRALPYVAVLSE